jgi:colicin import membrane protein
MLLLSAAGVALDQHVLQDIEAQIAELKKATAAAELKKALLQEAQLKAEAKAAEEAKAKAAEEAQVSSFPPASRCHSALRCMCLAARTQDVPPSCSCDSPPTLAQRKAKADEEAKAKADEEAKAKAAEEAKAKAAEAEVSSFPLASRCHSSLRCMCLAARTQDVPPSHQ